jgi:hypothetical protein
MAHCVPRLFFGGQPVLKPCIGGMMKGILCLSFAATDPIPFDDLGEV